MEIICRGRAPQGYRFVENAVKIDSGRPSVLSFDPFRIPGSGRKAMLEGICRCSDEARRHVVSRQQGWGQRR